MHAADEYSIGLLSAHYTAAIPLARPDDAQRRFSMSFITRRHACFCYICLMIFSSAMAELLFRAMLEEEA